MASKELSNEKYLNRVCTIDNPIILRKYELFITHKFTPLFMRSDGIVKMGIYTSDTL